MHRMRKTAKTLYLAALGALVLFVLANALFGVDAGRRPLAFEGLALLIFAPLAAAMWVDYRGRIVRPVWLFLLAATVSALSAVHLYLLVGLLI